MADVITPFVLSGGSGTRLWPLSRRAYPKQFIKDIAGETSLLQQTCRRLDDRMFTAPTVLANVEHRFLVAEQLRELNLAPEAIVLEPVGRNTAPAIATAALMAAERDENALMIVLPSDHVISDAEGFRQSIRAGTGAAKAGHIVIFGVRPTAPETGFGYIETRSGDTPVAEVAAFTEKPTRKTAEGYVASGRHYWNAGMFLGAARTFLQEFETHAPHILDHCRAALDSAVPDLDFLRLDKAAFEQADGISFDYAVMEKVSGVKCVPLQTEWSDLGSWPAIWDIADKDPNGNVTTGDVLLYETSNSYVHSTEGTCLSLIGLDGYFAVATRDAVLVAPKDRAQDVKHIVSRLMQDDQEKVINHMRVYRPWGWYEGLSSGVRFQVKCLSIKPGARLSLQSHHHRAEHWIIVSGSVKVTIDGETRLLAENQSTYIPIGSTHRLENPGKIQALLIEVQSGAYLGEDDIVRYEDSYGRTSE